MHYLTSKSYQKASGCAIGRFSEQQNRSSRLISTKNSRRLKHWSRRILSRHLHRIRSNKHEDNNRWIKHYNPFDLARPNEPWHDCPRRPLRCYSGAGQGSTSNELLEGVYPGVGQAWLWGLQIWEAEAVWRHFCQAFGSYNKAFSFWRRRFYGF